MNKKLAKAIRSIRLLRTIKRFYPVGETIQFKENGRDVYAEIVRHSTSCESIRIRIMGTEEEYWIDALDILTKKEREQIYKGEI